MRWRGAIVCGALVAAAACTASEASAPAVDAAAGAKVAAFTCPARAATAGDAHPRPAHGGRLHVVTTVAPITSIVGVVAGDAAGVRGLIPEGTDSHTYEPDPGAARTLAAADVVFVNGLKLEDPTRDLAAANVPDDAEVVALGDLALAPDEYLYDSSFPRAAGKPNPHLWTDPPMAACYARAAASVLGRADPVNRATYDANAAAFGAAVDDLDARMKTATATIPRGRRKLLTYHDAFAYFAAHYGWTVIGAIQVSSFEDPTPKEVAALIRQIEAAEVPAIFGSEVFPSPVLAQIGREAHVRYVDTLRDDDLPGDPGGAAHSYLGLMQADFVTMVDALGGDSTALVAFAPSGLAPDRAEYPQ